MAAAAVRAVDEVDVPRVQTLLAELGYASDASRVAARLRAAASDRTAVLVAEVDGQVVGLAAAHTFQPIEQDDRVCTLLVLIVSGEARGQGLGTQLVEAVERHATAEGCEALTVATPSHRQDAQRFYEARGYRVSGPRHVKVLSSGEA